MIRTAAIRTALIALAIAAAAGPALAQNGNTRAAMNAAAVAQGPGGCVTFNEALDQAVATQIRIGRTGEARRLASLRQPCPAAAATRG